MTSIRNIILLVVALSAACSAFKVGSFNRKLARVSTRPLAMAAAPENETDEEMRARLLRKIRKGMFNENGVAYAPWMSKGIDEDAIVDDLMRKEKADKLGGGKKKTSILDRGEVETSEGMRWRMTGNQVDLAWATGGETANKGYIVEKRPSYGGDFQQVASFAEVTSLVSKGASGGRYRYLDPSTAPGSWIYRVQDCDAGNKKNVLCQCFVEVQTEQENKTQGLLAVGLVGFFVVAAVVGFSLDPPQ